MQLIDSLKGAAARLGTLAAIVGLGDACFAQSADELKGRVERVQVYGASLEGNLMGETASPYVSVYLPPSYGEELDRRYPVVYFLHSYTGTDLAYFGPRGAQAQRVAERVFLAGDAREMILVMPNCMNAYGGCMYSNSVTAGNWEGFIADDLVAYMDENYRTLASRESRGLAGHSMGGYGTLRIGMKRPDVFSALYALSSCCLNEGNLELPSVVSTPADQFATFEEASNAPLTVKGTLARAAAWAPNPDNPPLYLDLPVIDGEVLSHVAVKWAANSPVALVASHVPNLKQLSAIKLDIGTQDDLIPSNEIFVAELDRFEIQHIYETYDGDHVNRVPVRFENHVLPFFSEHLFFGAN